MVAMRENPDEIIHPMVIFFHSTGKSSCSTLGELSYGGYFSRRYVMGPMGNKSFAPAAPASSWLGNVSIQPIASQLPARRQPPPRAGSQLFPSSLPAYSQPVPSLVPALLFRLGISLKQRFVMMEIVFLDA